MGLVKNATNSYDRVELGSALQVYYPQTAAQLGFTTIAAGSSYSTQVIITNGFKNFAFGVQSTQTGTVKIQRYLDQAGTIPQGAALTMMLTAAIPATLNVADNYPFQSMQITVSNTGMVTATITNAALLLQSY